MRVGGGDVVVVEWFLVADGWVCMLLLGENLGCGCWKLCGGDHVNPPNVMQQWRLVISGQCGAAGHGFGGMYACELV